MNDAEKPYRRPRGSFAAMCRNAWKPGMTVADVAEILDEPYCNARSGLRAAGITPHKLGTGHGGARPNSGRKRTRPLVIRKKRPEWNAGHDAQLRALRAEGYSIKACAEKMGRPHGTIAGRWWRMNWRQAA